MTTHVNDGGTWKSASPYVKDGATWKPVLEVWVKDGTVWKQAYASLTFTPDAGTYSASGFETASYTISCSQAATWTWTKSGDSHCSASLASGGSATSITFTCNAYQQTPAGQQPSPDDPWVQNSCTFTVTGTANGVTKNYTINLTATV
jgi:hypothetical protein